MAVGVVLPPLPEPRTTHHLEVQFRRLLHSCTSALGASSAEANTGNAETAVSTSASSLPGTGAPPSLHKCRKYVETLEELLADMESSGLAELDGATLELYRQYVKSLSGQLSQHAQQQQVQLPAYCKNLLASSTVAASGRGGGAGGGAHNLTPLRASVPAEFRSYSTPAIVTVPGGLTSAAKERLAMQGRLHDQLTDDLVGLASELKKSTMQVQEAVQRRGKVLEETDDALGYSTEQAKLSAARAKKQYKRTSGNLCMTCLLLLAVGMVFSGMAVYIKLTHLTGYRWVPSQRGKDEL